MSNVYLRAHATRSHPRRKEAEQEQKRAQRRHFLLLVYTLCMMRDIVPMCLEDVEPKIFWGTCRFSDFRRASRP